LLQGEALFFVGSPVFSDQRLELGSQILVIQHGFSPQQMPEIRDGEAALRTALAIPLP